MSSTKLLPSPVQIWNTIIAKRALKIVNIYVRFYQVRREKLFVQCAPVTYIPAVRGRHTKSL